MSAAGYNDHDSETGLLNAGGLARVIDVELSRAARHELPLSLVLLEVSGPLGHNGGQERSSAVAAKVARVLERRIRKEDWAARIGRLKFAVVAVETSDSAALASDFEQQVRMALIGPGEDGADLSVTVGAVDCHYDELSRDELIQQADKALATAMMSGSGLSFPTPAFMPGLHRPNGRR
jgi:diguanylate cyclase (GGDEF)-like protein